MQPESHVQPESQIETLIALVQKGDARAREALLDHACERLLQLTRRMFHRYPALRRWEQTDDVFQGAIVRLHRALEKVNLESARHFFNLAAMQIRRELQDLARRHFGPEGCGANHHTDHQPADAAGGSIHEIALEPGSMEEWSKFHELVDGLPEQEHEVVNLLWYKGLTQEEAAVVLGVSPRTVKRRWHSARLMFYEALQSVQPG